VTIQEFAEGVIAREDIALSNPAVRVANKFEASLGVIVNAVIIQRDENLLLSEGTELIESMLDQRFVDLRRVAKRVVHHMNVENIENADDVNTFGTGLNTRKTPELGSRVCGNYRPPSFESSVAELGLKGR
jgi:hypothetical protein